MPEDDGANQVPRQHQEVPFSFRSKVEIKTALGAVMRARAYLCARATSPTQSRSLKLKNEWCKMVVVVVVLV